MRLPLKAVIPLHNSSDYPALNVIVIVTVSGVVEKGEAVTETPLAAEDHEECSVSLNIVGDEAQTFGQAISGAGVQMSIQVEYDSVEGVRWFSTANYLVKTNPNRTDDQRLLDDAMDGRIADAGLWTAETTIDLDYSIVKNSWKYGEIGEVS